MSYIYLASPYSSPQAHIRRQRFILTCRCAAKLMSTGHIVYAPVVHGHAIDLIAWQFVQGASHEFWLTQCLPFIKGAHELCVLKLPGWAKSLGVAREIKEATDLGIPITYLDEEKFDDIGQDW